MKVNKIDHSWAYNTEIGQCTFEFCEVGKYKGKTFMIPANPTEDGIARAIEVNVTKSYKVPRVMGGGSVTVVEEVEIVNDSLTYKKVFFSSAVPGYFNIDGCDTYFGYSYKREWNGWACPLFDKETSMRIVNECCNNEYFGHRYDETKDILYIIDKAYEDEDPYELEGHNIVTESGDTVHVYDFGLLGWIWDEVENENDKVENE